MGAKQSMEDHIFNLKYNSKQLLRESEKCTKSAATNKLKCKQAMEVGNMDGARIYAESAIRDKNQSTNYLRLSSRIDAVSQRLLTASKLSMLSNDMNGIVNTMNSAMKSMNVEKISSVMDKFEQQFDNLEISTQTMESSIQSSTSTVMPLSQVDLLMKQVADENSLEFNDGLSVAPTKKLEPKVNTSAASEQKSNEPSLEERLRKLQG